MQTLQLPKYETEFHGLANEGYNHECFNEFTYKLSNIIKAELVSGKYEKYYEQTDIYLKGKRLAIHKHGAINLSTTILRDKLSHLLDKVSSSKMNHTQVKKYYKKHFSYNLQRLRDIFKLEDTDVIHDLLRYY